MSIRKTLRILGDGKPRVKARVDVYETQGRHIGRWAGVGVTDRYGEIDEK